MLSGIPKKQQHDITACKYYGVALTNDSKVVLAKFGETNAYDPFSSSIEGFVSTTLSDDELESRLLAIESMDKVIHEEFLSESGV